MRLVIIESPYKGDVARNMRYLDACIRDCLRRGESPLASHRMFTSALDDNIPEQRELGIKAGLAWREAMVCVREKDTYSRHEYVLPLFYTDLGWSGGMISARDLYIREDRPYDERVLPSGDSFFLSEIDPRLLCG